MVSGASAAAVHGVGDLRSGVHEFSSSTRRQSQRPDIRYRRRDLPSGAVTVVRGLPVTTLEQPLADLVNDGTDLMLVAQVYRDASLLMVMDPSEYVNPGWDHRGNLSGTRPG